MKFQPGAFYTEEMAKALRALKKPVPFTMDVSEDETGLHLLVYESEFRPMNDGQRVVVMEFLFDAANLLESYGPKVNIQGVPGEPRRV